MGFEIIKIIIQGIMSFFSGIQQSVIDKKIKGEKDIDSILQRKNKVYQPLLKELRQYEGSDWDLLTTVEVHFLQEIVENDYKYALNDELREKCKTLKACVDAYNEIKVIDVARKIVIRIFEMEFLKIYGDIDEITYKFFDEWGNEEDEKICNEPAVKFIREEDYSKQLEDLLKNEGRPTETVYPGTEISRQKFIYNKLRSIYFMALHVKDNGESYVWPELIQELGMDPDEYMAYDCDFFEEYNSNEKIKEKKKQQRYIINQSQEIVQELKERIEKIVKNMRENRKTCMSEVASKSFI